MGLTTLFAVEPPVETKAKKADKLPEAIGNDEVAQHLISGDWVKSTERDGRLHIRCPFEHEHTTESSDSATTYWPAHTGGFALGHFRCLHAHCEGRTDDEFRLGVGFDPFGFEDVSEGPQTSDTPEPAPELRFAFKPAHEFAAGAPPRWIVKGVLPQAALAVLYGEAGSGKSFFALDLVAAVARGVQWRSKRVRQTRVAYVVAEGAGGFRNRLKAYAHQQQIDLATLDVAVLGDAPNLMLTDDVRDLIRGLKAAGPVGVVVIDTLAQTTPGANENAGEDMGKAIAHCRAIHKKTGALVLLVHHSGKDASKGARGWSGLRAAADAEIEIVRADSDRTATITKQKDGQDGDEFGFKLVDVIVGEDEDGDDITSCFVEETASVAKEKKKREPGGKWERAAWRAAHELAELAEGAVEVAEVVEHAAKKMPHDPNDGRDRRREYLRRAIVALVDGGWVSSDGATVTVLR